MTYTIDLEKNVIENAKISACRISDKECRIRAYALNVAANATAQYLDKIGLESDTSLSLYKIATFEEQFEIADVYVKGFRFDVRVSFDGKTFTVPKVHAKYGATPLAYIVVKFDESLTKAEFLGFLPTEELVYPESSVEYYTFDTTVLKQIDEIKELIDNSTLNIHPYSANNHEKIKELSISFIDGEISESEKVFFIKQVLACSVCRESFCDVNDFDTIVAQIKNYQELLNDSTLSVLSGNKQEFDEAVLANLGFVENATENIEEVEDEITEESVLIDEFVVDELPTDEESTEDLQISDELIEENEENPISKDVQENSLIEEDDDKDSLLEDNFLVDEEILTIEETPVATDIPSPTEAPSVIPTTEDISLEQESSENLDLLNFVDDNDLLEQQNFVDEPSLNLEDSDIEIANIADKEAKSLEFVDVVDDSSPNVVEEINEESKENEESLMNFSVEDEPIELGENLDISEANEMDVLHDIEDADIEHLELHESVDILQEHPEHDILAGIHDSEEENILHEVSLDVTNSAENRDVNIEDSGIDSAVSENKSNNISLELPEDNIDKLADDINIVEENVDEEDIDEEYVDEEDVIDETVSKNEETNMTYTPFVPVELKYDDDENSEEEDNDVVSEKLTDASDNQDEQQETDFVESENSVDEDIQNLLDDDLMALLSDDSSGETVVDSGVIQEDDGSGAVDDMTVEPVDQFDSDENIGTLYENTSEHDTESIPFELASEPISDEVVKKTKSFAVIAGLLIVLLGAGSSMFVLNKQKSMQADDAISGNEMFDFSTKSEDENNNLPAVSQDINRSIANSFSDKPSAITITKLSWQISEKLAVEPSVKEYLQTAGKNIQMNLQNDIANSAEVVMNNLVKVSLTIAADNTLKGLQILESSGSDAIDETITKSIKNTLNYVRVPKLKDYKSDYFLTLIINF